MRLKTFIPSLVLGLFFPSTGHSQSSVDALRGSSDAAQGVFDRISGNTDTDTVTPAYSVGSEYPEGMVAYLKENVRYPQSEYDTGIQGKVYVEFVVNKDGNVVDVKVVRGVSPGLDAEAVRVVRGMPKLTPDEINGKPTSTRFVIPIAFSLPNPETPSKN